MTEIVLALAMIAVILVLRPGGLFATREIGALLLQRKHEENRG